MSDTGCRPTFLGETEGPFLGADLHSGVPGVAGGVKEGPRRVRRGCLDAVVCSSLIYRWRRELAAAPGGFAEVIVSPVDSDDDTGGGDGPGRGSAVAARPDFGDAAAAIEVAVGGAAQVRIPATIPPALAAAVIAALVGR